MFMFLHTVHVTSSKYGFVPQMYAFLLVKTDSQSLFFFNITKWPFSVYFFFYFSVLPHAGNVCSLVP